MPEEKPRRKSTKQSLLAGPDGTPFLAKHVPKFVRDTLRFAHGVGQDQTLQFDPSNPLGREHLVPGPNSPICIKCKLCTFGATNPFLPYEGSEQPEIVVITEQVSAKEDGYAQVGHGGPNLFMRRLLTEQLEEIGMSIDCVRWLPITRCAAITGKRPNFRTHGNWCRLFLVQELQRLKPKIILAVGSTVLGLLCHKSSAQDWGGRVLTWRGWPDDWLTDPDYMLPRVHPSGEGEVVGHPIMGQPPEGVAIPLFPVQSPKLVYATQNPGVIKRWKGQVKTALELAKSGFTSPVYDRKWFKITEDPAEIKQELKWLIDHPGTLTCFDTETTGLKPFGQNQTIVFMMFRWEDDKGKPRSIGFPWDYDGSALRPHINDVSPVVLEALYASRLVGHNLTFDVLFTYANVPGCDLERLTNAAVYDTWHIAYVSRQQTGSLGLDLIAYDWCKDMAGYEEAMTMLIELHRDSLDPGAGKGGHYANCPRDKWDTHLKPYVMGDVEVCYQAYRRLNDRLDACKTYAFPLAHPTNRGRFRTFRAPSRRWVYDKVVGPAAQVLARMMGRGLYVDQDELASQEDLFPKKIIECRNKIKSVTPAVEDWCRQMEATEPGWSFDPESKDHLKTVLYDILKLPVKRLTEAGKKLYSDDTPQDLAEVPPDDLLKYAALDKFTLNMLSVDHPEVRPLQEYRKVFKLYSTYVRTMRNFYSAGIDKREREKDQHLMRDGMVHTTFKIPGTRGGRLSCVVEDTLVETTTGLVPIWYLGSANNQQVSVRSHVGRWRRVVRSIYLGRERCVKVTTSEGKEITCSLWHRLFGPSGWVDAGDLSVGDEVYSPRRLERGDASSCDVKDDIRGGVVYEVVFGLDPNGQTAHVVGVVSKASAVNKEGIQAEICSTAEEALLGQVAVKISWKQEGCKEPWDYPSERRVAEVAGSWLASIQDRETLQCLRFYSGQECTVSRCGETKKPELAPDAGGNERIFRDRQAVSWNAGGGKKISDEQERFCDSLLQRLCEALQHGAVHQRCSSKSSKGRDGTRPGAQEVEPVSEPCRVSSCTSAVVGGSSIRSSVQVFRQDVRGLCVRRDQLDRGDRRVVPQTISRLEERQGVERSRVRGDEVYRRGDCEINRRSFSQDHGLYPVSIVKVEDAGVLGVWDIEVEEDHSYCSDGFVNHNSSDPNVQQIPRDGLVKRLYTSRFGNEGCILGYDLSQIELRLLAAACGDQSMVAAYHNGVDLHSLTQSNISGKPYEECTNEYVAWLQKNGKDKEGKAIKEMRKIAKTVNFLTGYGGGAFGLMTSLAQQGIYKTLDECEYILEAFFDAYPSLRTYLSYYKRFIMETGVAVSILGRVRIFEEVFGDNAEATNKALRAGCNHLIQSTASDVMLVIISVVEHLMREAQLQSKLVLTVHDSMFMDAKRSELDQLHSIGQEVLNNIPEVLKLWFGADYDDSWIIVPLAGDGQVGHNMLDMREIVDDKPDWDRLLAPKEN